MSFDPRPSKLVCAVTGANAPDDVYNAFIEFEKGMDTSMFDPVYVVPKLAQLTQHVEWCRLMAEEELRQQIEDEGDLCGECGSELRTDGEPCTSCEAER